MQELHKFVRMGLLRQSHFFLEDTLVNLIGAVDRNWGIGKDGRLLVSIPLDQKLFRQDTLGKIVVMGRKTFESLPGKRPLDGRLNIVLSRSKDFSPKGVYVTNSVEHTLSAIKQCMKRGFTEKDVFVIGGEEIYRLFLPYCDTAHITQVDYEYEADTHMPDLSEDPNWKLTDESEELTYFDVPFYFRKYSRVNRHTIGE